MLDKYATAELGSLDLSAVMTEVIDLMKLHDASMPAGLSTLARGLATIEGVVEDLSPNIQIINVASARISGMLLREFDWKGLLRNDLSSVTDSAHKALNLPAQISDLLATLNTGDEAIRMSVEPGSGMQKGMDGLVRSLCLCILSLGLFIFAGLALDKGPTPGGFPLLSCLALICGAVLAVMAFFKKKE